MPSLTNKSITLSARDEEGKGENKLVAYPPPDSHINIGTKHSKFLTPIGKNKLNPLTVVDDSTSV